MNAYAKLWVVVATVVGTWAYMGLADHLDRTYRPFSNDMPFWVLFALPIAATLSGMTASALASVWCGNFRAAAIKCLATGVPVGALFLWSLQDMTKQYSYFPNRQGADYALAMCGPTILWCALLLILGLTFAVAGWAGAKHVQ